MPQPKFTKLKDTGDFSSEASAKLNELGPATGANAAAWQKFAGDITKEIETNLKTYEDEQRDYFTWIAEQMKSGKQLVEQAGAIAAQLVAKWDDKDRALLDKVSAGMKTLLADIAQAKKDCVNHQGFRGNLGFAVAGYPPVLEKYEAQFKSRRKAIIDQHDALMSKVDKLKTEYVARIDNAIKLADKAKAQGGRTLVVASDELKELEKLVDLWSDEMSSAFDAVKKINGRIRDGVTSLESAKNATEVSFKAIRLQYPILKKAVQTTKEALNSDFKRFETLKASLGAEIYDKKALDQKLVTKVEKGFTKARDHMKTYYDSLEKLWEKEISKLEKKKLKT